MPRKVVYKRQKVAYPLPTKAKLIKDAIKIASRMNDEQMLARLARFSLLTKLPSSVHLELYSYVDKNIE